MANVQSTAQHNLDKLLQSLGDYFIPQLECSTRGKLATTSVSPWCAVDSARAAGECVTQLPLKLETDGSGSWTFYRLDPESGRAVQIGPPYQGGFRTYYSCIAIGSKIFVIGGGDSNYKTLDSAEVYDYCTGSWSTLAPMSTARQAHCCTAIGSKICVVGGVDSDYKTMDNGIICNINYKVLDSVEVYDSSTGSWSTLPPMSTARGDHRCTAIGSKIFVIGGMDSNEQGLDSVEVYDSSTDLWSTMAPMSTARHSHSCTAIGSQIFVVGGCDSNSKALDSVEVYDSSTDLWSTLSPMSTARHSHSCTAIGSKIFVVGGCDNNDNPLDSVEVYDSSTDLWSALAPMSTARHSQSCTAIGSQIFVIGGIDSNYDPVDSVEVYDASTDLWSSTSAEEGCELTGSYGIKCEVTEQATTSPILSLLCDRF